MSDSTLYSGSARLCTLATSGGWSDAVCILLLQNLSNQISSAGPNMLSRWLASPVKEESWNLQQHRHHVRSSTGRTHDADMLTVDA